MTNNNSLSDELASVSPRVVACAVMEIANKLQDYPPAVQLAAIGYCFRAYLEVTKKRASDVLDVVENLRVEQGSVRPEFTTVEQYLKNEVLL